MKAFRAVSIVGLVALAALACSAQLAEKERARLAQDSEILQEISQKWLAKASSFSQAQDAPHWTKVGQLIASIDSDRQSIMGRALDGPQGALQQAYDEAQRVAGQHLQALKDLLDVGDMKSTKLAEDLLVIESMIHRKLGRSY